MDIEMDKHLYVKPYIPSPILRNVWHNSHPATIDGLLILYP